MNGDKLEVRFCDSGWNTYYKKKMSMLDIKQWQELINDLRDKGGVNFINITKKEKEWW